MTEFRRGINNKDFINALNKLYQDKSSFWYKMIHDKDLFIAIRKEYLNVYFKGQSMCRIFFNKGLVQGETHKKYLGFRENGYFRSNGGIFSNPNAKIKNLSELESIKKNVIYYIGKEKSESYKEVMDRDKSIIDVEIALVKNKVPIPQNKSDYQISSIDYLSLESNELVFYEAKHFTNAEIRSRTTPKVFEQIDRYKMELIQHEVEILKSYKLVLQNLRELHIYHSIIIPEMLDIDFTPFLIIFDITRNEINDIHLQKLRNQFGEKLILKYKN